MSGDRSGHDLEALARQLADLDAGYRSAVQAGGGSQAASQALQALLGADGIDLGWMAVPDARGLLSINAVLGAQTGRLKELAIREGAGLTGKVFLSGRPEWIDRYLDSDRITHEFDHIIAGEGLVRLLAVPVVRDGRVTGVLAAGGRGDGDFGDRAVALALSAARSLSLAEDVADRERRATEAAAGEARHRIALNLHDSLGAMLYSIGADARGLRENVDADPALLARLERLSERTSEASTLLREALRALHASPTELSLGATLQDACRDFEARTGIRTQVLVLSALPHVPDGVLGEVLRAFREALHNVEKHADAAAVFVTVWDEAGRLALVVADDGGGVRTDGRPTGFGLDASRASIERLGGTLFLRDGADGGAVWRLTVPLQHS